MGGALFWTKALGSLFIICAGILGGKLMAGKLERELEELGRFELALLNLSTEISYSLSPLPKALANAGRKAGGDTGILFSLTGSLCGLEQRRTVEEAFGLALERSQGLNLSKGWLLMTVLVRNLGVWGQGANWLHRYGSKGNERSGPLFRRYSKKARMSFSDSCTQVL